MILQSLSAQVTNVYSLFTHSSPLGLLVLRFRSRFSFDPGMDSRFAPAFLCIVWGARADRGGSPFRRVCFVLGKLLSNLDTVRSRACNIRGQLLGRSL